jgi:succinoglycan biosynthesis transport protein ExoP
MNKLVQAVTPLQMEAVPQPNDNQVIDLGVLMRFVRRRLRIMMLVGAVVLAAMAGLTMSMPPVYTSSATVVLDTNRQALAGIERLLTSAPTGTTGVVETEAQVVESRGLAERVARRLRLDQDPEFNPALRRAAPKGFLNAILAQKRSASEGGQPATDPMPAVVAALRSKISVRRSGLTYAIDISASSNKAATAAQLANAFAEEYIAQQVETKAQSIDRANAWLNAKVGALGEEVRRAEEQVSQYQVANNLLTGANDAPLAQQDVANLTEHLTNALARQAAADAQLAAAQRQAANGGISDDMSNEQGSSVMHSLRTQKAVASQKLADLSARYKPSHPEVVQTRKALDEIDEQIAQEASRILANLTGQASAAGQEVATLTAEVNRAKAALAANNRASVKLQELNRNASTLRSTYDTAVGSEKQTSLQAGFPSTDARIVSAAAVPGSPTSPNKMLFAVIGVLFAGMAALGAGVVAEFNDHAIRSTDQLTRRFGVESLDMLPFEPRPGARRRGRAARAGRTPHAGPADYIIERPLSRLAESFRGLAAVLYAPSGPAPQVLAVTSSLPGEGKTTTSLALARTLASSGRNVVIVDCDLRRRGLTTALGISPEVGLREVLEGQSTLDEALIADAASGACILPIATASRRAATIDADRMAGLIATLRERFERVILDTAPVLAIADTRVVAAMADSTVLLARWNSTQRSAVEEALEALNGVGADVVGVALTQVDLRRRAQYGMTSPGWYLPENRGYYVD